MPPATATTPANRPASYDKLIADHEKLIHKVAHKLPFGTHEDMVQDIYVELLRKWKMYDSEKYKFSTWVWLTGKNVYTVHNTSAATAKRTGRTVAMTDDMTPSAMPTQHDYAELSETLRRLSGTRDSEALIRIAMGDELQDVANDMGVSRERVRQLADRERRRLRVAA